MDSKGREIVFTGKQRIELLGYEDGPLAPTEVRGPTLTTLISPGTELAWANGDNFPLRPGYAAVFEAAECGPQVKSVKPGDQLLCMGGHRSTQRFDESYVVKLPDGMKPETAVIARLMAVSMTTLMTTTARPGDIVLVCGAGPVGYLAAHQFAGAGYEVAVVEPNDKRRGDAAASGIAATFASVPLDDADYAGKVALVVECSGHEQSVVDGCKIVRKRGEVVLIGVPWKAYTSLTAHEVMHAVFFNYTVLRSGWEWEVPLLSRDFVWEELYEGYNNAPHSTFSGLRRALGWLDCGWIPLDGLIRTLPPADPGAVYGALMRNEIYEPFTVLDWRA